MNVKSLFLVLIGSALIAGCQSSVPVANPADDPVLPPVLPVRSESHLLEILHYAALWHYDRSFLVSDPDGEVLDILYRQTYRELDEGDQTIFGELWIPEIKMLIEIEKSDYQIEELELHVLDDIFKVRRVVRIEEAPVSLMEYRRHTIAYEHLREWYADNIRVATPISETLSQRLREAILAHPIHADLNTGSPTIFHIAPISPACDDLWVFHENNKQLLLFSSDMDLSNEEYWSIMPISLKVYDLDPELILAPDEGAQGTARLSKDFVGRALFNCVVLGERIEVSPDKVKQFLEEKSQLDNYSNP